MNVIVISQEMKRMAVVKEQQRRVQEAMASKPAPSEDNFELKAMKAMGAMDEGDAVFGSGAEVNLDSQVSFVGHSPHLLPLYSNTLKKMISHSATFPVLFF
jgi:hypothetical protein